MLSTTLRASQRRAYATAASGNINVASINRGQPTSSITVFVKAGSRYEPKPGVAHCLKHFAFKDTVKRSALRGIRETELFGGVLSSSLSREHLALTADFLPGNESFFVDLLASQITSPRFARHEFLETVSPLVKGEAIAAFNDPRTLAIELAHSIAFRTGLGSSLFASTSNVVTSEDVQKFASEVYAKNNIAIIGTGVDEAVLQKLVAEHFGSAASGSGSGPSSNATKYHGGETRIAPSPESHFHGPHTIFIGYGSSSSASELAILSAHLDPTPSIKWAQSTSPLASALVPGTTIQSVYLPYSDATLAGIVIGSKTAAGAATAANAVVKALRDVKGGALQGEAFSVAAAKARFRAASALEERDVAVGALGSKLLGGGSATAESLIASLENVDEKVFAKTASTLLGSKPTYVAIGDINGLPFADELGL